MLSKKNHEQAKKPKLLGQLKQQRKFSSRDEQSQPVTENQDNCFRRFKSLNILTTNVTPIEKIE